MKQLHSEIFVPHAPSSSTSEVGPSLKCRLQLGVCADPAGGRDVPAPLNSFNRIGPAPPPWGAEPAKVTNGVRWKETSVPNEVIHHI